MQDVIIRIEGAIGRITLNRPQALNALSHEMSLQIEAALRDWIEDHRVSNVMIDAEGGRAFCAGGDIVAIYHAGAQSTMAADFWRDEYRMNALIGRYPKPFIAVMDGIVMGGGVGLAGHGTHRIVTEATTFAMPECAIGLIPDVGGTHLLGRMPGYAGFYAGLTGARLTGADCLYAGLADYYIPKEALAPFKEALISHGDLSVIEEFTTNAPPSVLAQNQNQIDALFCYDSPEQIMDALGDHDSEFAQKALAVMETSSPWSLRLTFDLLKKAQSTADLKAALRAEYRVTSRAVAEGDFLEGIRAMLIDRDRAPRWRYDQLENFPKDQALAFHQLAKGGDISFEWPAR